MNNLLIFFALPLATIIIAVVLERIWKNYILVTLFTFAVYLIVAFAIGDATLLILVIIYTILAFLSAFLSMLFRKIWEKLNCLEATLGTADEENKEHKKCCKCNNNNLNNSANDNSNCNNSQNYEINANITPNSSNNGNAGTFRGRYRRRF